MQTNIQEIKQMVQISTAALREAKPHQYVDNLEGLAYTDFIMDYAEDMETMDDYHVLLSILREGK